MLWFARELSREKYTCAATASNGCCGGGCQADVVGNGHLALLDSTYAKEHRRRRWLKPPICSVQASESEVPMTRKILASLVLIGAASMASAGPRGTVPKASVGEYAAHAERNGLGVGATLLTSDQVHKKFATDVNHCCVVVEIAFYPQKDKALDVSLDDIMIQTESDGLGAAVERAGGCGEAAGTGRARTHVRRWPRARASAMSRAHTSIRSPASRHAFTA